MKKIELLSPAGSKEALVPAIRMGADAVYLGSKEFSARRNAKNFNRDELKEAVEYCHIRGVKIYLTINTLIKDEEMDAAVDLARYAASINIDALIVQDLGFASILRLCAPDLKLHASTQMSVHTPAGVKLLEDMGFSRVVLARELSKSEIIEIRESSKIELEIFVHGALCMSVSGQCYFSSMLGGRSGNRGLCAQPCRLPFKVDGGTGHDLSLKDLSLVNYIDELSKIGVNSAKIEGRMKRPEYVAAAVNAYRKAIDGIKKEENIDLLKSVFSRSGFTDGYYTNKRGISMFGTRSKEDVISATNKVFSKLRQMYKSENQNIPIHFDIKIKKDLPIELKIYDEEGNSASLEGLTPEIAVKHDLDCDRCVKQLKKTGQTPFFVKNICCEIDNGLSIPISYINSLRRNTIKQLEEKRKIRKPIKFSTDYKESVKNNSKKFDIEPKIRARFPNCDIPENFKICEMIYVPINSKKEDLLNLIERGFNLCIEIPRVFFGKEKEKEIINLLKKVKSIGIEHVWAGNIGAVKIALDLKFKVHGGFSLNLMNSYSVKWAENLGIQDIETSFEMTLDQISNLKGNINRGIIAYGRLPLMITRNCPAINGNENCTKCKEIPKLIDRKGIEFPMMCSFGCTEILNSVPLYMGDKVREIKGIDFLILRFTVENSVESGENFKVFNERKKQNNGITKGLYYRDVD